MQTINQLTANVNQKQNSTEICSTSNMQNATDNHSQPSEQLINSIANMFVEWQILYDNKMKAEDWGLETIERWARILTRLKITKSEFDRAEAAAELLGGWPIKHPADFLALGRIGTANGYPDTRKAYEHAVDYSGRLFDDRDDWQHVVIYETARRIGFTKLATSSELFTWSLWRDNYAKVCDEHKAGAEFNLPLDKSKQLAHSHAPVQAGSEADKRISEKLAELRRMSA